MDLCKPQVRPTHQSVSWKVSAYLKPSAQSLLSMQLFQFWNMFAQSLNKTIKPPMSSMLINADAEVKVFDLKTA